MYSLRYECSADAAGPAGAGAESRLRPQAGLRHLVRARQAAALRPGLRDLVPAGPRRHGDRLCAAHGARASAGGPETPGYVRRTADADPGPGADVRPGNALLRGVRAQRRGGYADVEAVLRPVDRE